MCLSLFPWAHFRTTKSAVKLHTLLDLRGNIPAFLRVTTGDLHDVNILDEILPEPGAFYVMDRAYIDFARLYQLHLAAAFFVTRSKRNVLMERRYSRPVDKSTGLRSDQTVILTTLASATAYPEALRRICYFDAENNRRLKFLTNNFALPALTIAQLYKQRWQVELFFRWIKQHLRIKAFYGTSANAVRTQIWIAVSVYVLVAIVRKRLELRASLYQILQILSVTLFEKTPILRTLQEIDCDSDLYDTGNQLNLFSLQPDSRDRLHMRAGAKIDHRAPRKRQRLERRRYPLPALIGVDESPSRYSLARCAPAEPASASPTWIRMR